MTFASQPTRPWDGTKQAVMLCCVLPYSPTWWRIRASTMWCWFWLLFNAFVEVHIRYWHVGDGGFNRFKEICNKALSVSCWRRWPALDGNWLILLGYENILVAIMIFCFCQGLSWSNWSKMHGFWRWLKMSITGQLWRDWPALTAMLRWRPTPLWLRTSFHCRWRCKVGRS